MAYLDQFLKVIVAEGGSDLHIGEGQPPKMRKHGDVAPIREKLLDHDETFAHWRARHVLMVERQIGSKTGTGGSSGVEYLRSTLDKRFYPELWEVRSQL